jgi:hypothetical protein
LWSAPWSNQIEFYWRKIKMKFSMLHCIATGVLLGGIVGCEPQATDDGLGTGTGTADTEWQTGTETQSETSVETQPPATGVDQQPAATDPATGTEQPFTTDPATGTAPPATEQPGTGT